MKKKDISKTKPHRYTDEEKQFFKNFVPGHSYKEIQSAFTKAFNWSISINQIKSFISSNNLNTGRTGRFEKGDIPPNKGKKMPENLYKKCEATMFKKGHIPKDTRKVGSERIDSKDGYIHIKVKEPNFWKLKHRVIWEKEHGKIPEDSVIIFKDNNNKNCNIENLMLVKRSALAVMSRQNLHKYKNEEKETAALIAETIVTIAEAKKRKANQE